jgi:hypothetical protein
MIPTVADDDTLETYVSNIITKWHEATADQRQRGRSWYQTANQLAAMMSNGNTRACAGVLAALSPQKAWEHNIKLAQDAFANGEARGHVRNACQKAERIMLGEDPLQVLPAELKTWNFFRCIADPDDPEAVVIDRHAHDIAVGEVYGGTDRGLDNKRRYATLSLAYRIAANRLDEIPSVVQAVTWVAHVERER